MPDSLAALKTCVQLWCRKLDDTEFRNPFDRAYVRVVEDREGGGGGGGRGGEPGQPVAAMRSCSMRSLLASVPGMLPAGGCSGGAVLSLRRKTGRLNSPAFVLQGTAAVAAAAAMVVAAVATVVAVATVAVPAGAPGPGAAAGAVAGHGPTAALAPPAAAARAAAGARPSPRAPRAAIAAAAAAAALPSPGAQWPATAAAPAPAAPLPRRHPRRLPKIELATQQGPADLLGLRASATAAPAA
jgi:hypothetical protein